MPETLAGSIGATAVCAVLVVLSHLATRRWGTARTADPVRVAWDRIRAVDAEWGRPLLATSDEGRRGIFRRRKKADEAEPPTETDDPTPTEEATPTEDAPPAPVGTPGRGVDHVPFGGEDTDGSDEEELRFRERLRRGLTKTRDYLNRDVREVFGSGPIAESFDELEELLVRSDVGVATATALADELRERGRDLTSDTLLDALRESMQGFLGEADRRLRVNPDRLSVWLVVGVNGTGKTTTIAKLAAHAKSQGFGVCLAASDTFRAAAIEQLETWAERVDVPVIRQEPGSDPAAVAYDAVEHARARGLDLVIVDTAGRLHTRKPLMEELGKVRRVLEREPGLITECLLVVDATTGQNGIAQAKAFGEAVDVTGLVLAKLDGSAKGGIAFAVERELDVPVKAVGVGEKADDLIPFDPRSYVDAIVG